MMNTHTLRNQGGRHYQRDRATAIFFPDQTSFIKHVLSITSGIAHPCEADAFSDGPISLVQVHFQMALSPNLHTR